VGEKEGGCTGQRLERGVKKRQVGKERQGGRRIGEGWGNKMRRERGEARCGDMREEGAG